MKLAQKFEFHIREAIVADLQMNPYIAASMVTQKSIDDPETIELATREGGIIDQWSESLRDTAYIFGDTYKGMPIVETIKALISEGFDPIESEGGHKFQHEVLGITAHPRCNKDSQLISLTLDVAMKVHIDRVNATTCCGLGLKNPNVIGDIFYTKISATGGLKVKMFVLRSMAKLTVGNPS